MDTLKTSYQTLLETGTTEPTTIAIELPPTIARTLGLRLIAIGDGEAAIEFVADMGKHANPMGTLQGGVICDVADCAIGCAHSAGLQQGEPYTSVDLAMNFSRPVFSGRIVATASAQKVGRTLSRYVCDITNHNGKLMAQVASTVMTLRRC
ncbi:MAG: PaaI family thioesterase [Pseudomonadota bacterium]